jgi:hypothetical protein
MRSTILPVLLLAGLLLGACKKENTIPILTVTPNAPDIDVVSGNVIAFEVRGRSDNSSLARVIITSKKANSFSVVRLDTAISGTNFAYGFEYLVEHATVPYTEELKFQLIDANGKDMVTTRTLYVTLGAVVLTETAGHSFYSANSFANPEAAFDLEERVPVLVSVDSTRRDIQDDPLSAGDTDISRRWRSPAGGRFVRFNGFDYANATNISVQNAFDSGVPVELLTNVQAGDVILMQLGSQPLTSRFYAVIRVVDVLDQPGPDNDRYLFNMKWTQFEN